MPGATLPGVLRAAAIQIFASWNALAGVGRRGLAAYQAWVGAERGRFLPWLAVAMGAGALAYLSLRSEPAWWVGAAGLLCGVALACAGFRLAEARAAGLVLFSMSLGFAAGQVAAWRALPIEPLPRRAAVLTAVVQRAETIPAGRRLILFDLELGADGPKIARTVRVRLRPNDPAAVDPGDVIRVRALIRPPSPPAYPGGWDLQRDAFFGGIAGYGTALGPVELVSRAEGGGVAQGFRGLRDRIAGRIMAALPDSSGRIAAALMTGGTAAIPPDDRAAFRDSGLAHLLAVAGLHIGSVMALVFWLTRLALAAWERAALRWPTRAMAGIAALAAGAGYAALTGGHVPVLRSLAMACLVTLALLVGRRALSLRGLALAAAAIVLAAPQEVGGVSFQMSFSAVLALIAGFEALRPWLMRLRGRRAWWGRAGGVVAALALTSLLAGTASAPYGAFHFGRVQLYYVLANLVAVPICAMISLPLGLAALLLMPFGLEAAPLLPMGWSLDAVLWVGRTVASWPDAVLAVPHIPGWGLCLFSLGLAWLCLWRSSARLLGLAPITLGLAASWFTTPPDLIVSADARLILVRDRGTVLIQAQSGANKFTRDALLAYLGADRAAAFPKPGQPALPGLECGRDACRAARPGGTALVLRRDAPPEAGCGEVNLVVSPEPARGACPAAIPLIDRFTVWRNGSHAVWLADGWAEILSDRAYRGARPWVPPPPHPRREVPALPMAEREPLDAEAPAAKPAGQ